MWNFLVEVDYQDLAVHLATHIEHDIPTAPSFEVTREYLTLKTEQLMNHDCPVTGGDQELLDILMRHHTAGVVTDINVTNVPAVVIRVNDYHMVMPFVLIKLQL
jgi:hypothetical protein